MSRPKVDPPYRHFSLSLRLPIYERLVKHRDQQIARGHDVTVTDVVREYVVAGLERDEKGRT